jgi:hypothetical protein
MTYIQFQQAGSATGHGAGASPHAPRTELQGGQAVFSNGNYTVTAADDGQLHVRNEATGATSTLSPPTPPGGGEFRGSAAFVLQDGTALRLDVLPGTDGQLRRDLTIVDGDYSAVVSGIASSRRVPAITERPAGELPGARDNRAPWLAVDAGGLAGHVDRLYRNVPAGLSPLGPPPIGATPELRMGNVHTIAPLPPSTADGRQPTDLERAMAVLQAQYEDQLRANPELRSVMVSGIFVIDGREVKIQVAVDQDDEDDPAWNDAPALDLGDDTPPSRLGQGAPLYHRFGPPAHRG